MSYESVIVPTPEIDARTAFVCARLSLRGAKRLLQKGSITRGMSALYDSILFAMHYYIAKHPCADIDAGDAAKLFHSLTRLGLFNDPHSFDRLSLTVERALWQEPKQFDTDPILLEVETMLTKLGVVKLTKSILIETARVSQ
jgi:hypothetical protein